MQGQIIKVYSDIYTVKCGEELYGCRARGIFKKDKISPIVGDNVIIDLNNNIITKILPRKNELKRPVISNIDLAFIITSVKNPSLDLILLDKLITIITFNKVEPIICFTKLDLLNEEELKHLEQLKNYYEMIGIKTVYNTDITTIKKLISNKIAVFAGQTGAGKSSLLNKLDENLNIKTATISKALGRGKHTTRHVELYSISDGYIADTPGFSALDLDEMTIEDLKNTFIEFKNYECKFNDCIHNKEIGCSVKKAVEEREILKSRYDNYLLFMEELKK